MSNPIRDNKKQTNKTQQNESGSAYNREHAGHVEGYGEPYPITDNAKKNESTD
ncbi:hypothetical protein [Metabacillus schmidteae]|uniref:hypothetical protein n=1 Tax=Metabacillus schmidteae TaxID=2730405 RepID=UPI00158A62F1|nr:hypothetical protein [Metabacillus schmidteae]